ncbi:hypothetical protein [uncultured Alsobacter sp.]|uniref:hypothetical protein n=1 Tax=uncultured Alsobacter sp. TaxID=1748258 RepID=UPI0025D09E65|nr:hypothetical protein [uncultured Alsobacter sp.]
MDTKNVGEGVRWEQREFVTIREAQDILGCSRCRIQNAWISGKIELHEPATGGPRVIAVADVKRLAAAARPIDRPGFRRGRPMLKLVIDNG